jgi:4-carboxymuconolactone decarboxylase
MSRLPGFTPDILNEDQKVLYEAIAGGERARRFPARQLTTPEGSLRGPFNALLTHPKLGLEVQAVGSSLVADGVLENRLREIAILMVAARYRADYEWHAHEIFARRDGLSDPELDAIKARRPAEFEDDAARIVAETVRALLDEAGLDDDLYARATAALGTAGLTEIIMTVGYYIALALLLNTYRVPVPEGAAAPFGEDGPTSDRG